MTQQVVGLAAVVLEQQEVLGLILLNVNGLHLSSRLHTRQLGLLALLRRVVESLQRLFLLQRERLVQ